MRRAYDDDAALVSLRGQLGTLQRRAARLKPKFDGDTIAWQRWSTTIEEALSLVGQISRTPASGLRGVSAKLDAVIWLLIHDDAILDAGAQRRLQTLGREVRALASR